MQEGQRVPRLRSRSSLSKVLVRFANVTERTIKIVWINFAGQYIEYKDLKPRQTLDVTTYKTHPWMAFDIETSDRMHIDKSYVFMPKSWKDHVANIIFPNGDIPDNFEPRILIRITLPLYSLRYISLMSIRNCLKNSDDALQLELPKQLIDDVRKAVHFKQRQTQPYRLNEIDRRGNIIVERRFNDNVGHRNNEINGHEVEENPQPAE